MPTTNMKKIGTKDILSDAATYISEPGVLTVNLQTFVLSVHDGYTPGGLPVGGGSPSSISSINVVGGSTGLTTSGGPITSGTGVITVQGILNISNGGTGSTSAIGARNAILPAQTNNVGKFLSTDGVNVNWVNQNYSSIADTLIVAKNGNDASADGSYGKPFATIQAAHNYARDNFLGSNRHVVLQLNAGIYTENVVLTRTNTHLVGPTQGIQRAVWIVGSVTVNSSTAGNGVYNEIFGISNVILSGSGNNTVLTLAGSERYTFFGKDLYVQTESTTAKVVEVTNNSVGGIKVDFSQSNLQNQSSSADTIAFSNTFYANLNYLNIYSGTGAAMVINTTNVVLNNSRIEGSTSGNLVNVISAFGTQFNPMSAPAGSIALTTGNSTFVNGNATGDGINIALAATAAVAQCGFRITNGVGFAVRGVSGSFFFNGGNQIVPGSNAKVSTAIGAGNIPYTSSFTPS